MAKVSARQSDTIPQSPFFSLVVPTVGRQTEVAALLHSIETAAISDIEVIIVDQNCDDRLAEICRKYAERFPLIHLKVQFKGASRARNYGARLASGTVVNFPDDDCELTADYLCRAKTFFKDRRGKVLTGICADRSGNPSTSRFVLDERPLTPWSMWGRMIEFTMFLDRQTFLATGGFDEQFGVGAEFGSDEAPELLIRLLRSVEQGQVHYSHRLRCFHPNNARNFSPAGVTRAYTYSKGSGALLAKAPSLPVVVRSASLIARAAVAGLIYKGDKGRYYRARVAGFVDGFRAYKLIGGRP